MNYLTDPIEKLKVYLVDTDDEDYEENETEGILSVDTEKRRFSFIAKGKFFKLSTKYEIFELVMEEDEMTTISLYTNDYFYSFVAKEEMDKATAELLMLAGQGEING